MGTGDILLGGTLQWTSIPSRGSSNMYSQLPLFEKLGLNKGRVQINNRSTRSKFKRNTPGN